MKQIKPLAVVAAGVKDLLLSDELDLEGSKLDLVKFLSLFDKPEGRFNVVTP